jgi:hypothetical protein
MKSLSTSALLLILGWVIFGLHFLLDIENPFYQYLSGFSSGMFLASLVVSIRNERK